MAKWNLRDATEAANNTGPIEQPPEPVPIAMLDPEVAAIHHCVRALETLDAASMDRVLEFLMSRFRKHTFEA